MKQKKTKQLYIISGILAVVILAGTGSIVFIHQKTSQMTQYKSASATAIPSVSITHPACATKQAEDGQDVYSCPGFSMTLPKEWSATTGLLTRDQIPKEWQYTGNVVDSEFINYDLSKAAGRSYSPQLDKGKKKFGIETVSTKMNLNSLAVEEAKAVYQEIISNTPTTLNGQTAIDVYTKSPTGYSHTYYIQNQSKDFIAIVTPIFGFDNLSEFESQILSGFKFLK